MQRRLEYFLLINKQWRINNLHVKNLSGIIKLQPMQITEYVNQILKPLLDHPEELTVNESQDPMGILLTIKLHKEDMGVVIGKAGETAKAVRHLTRIVGIKGNARVSIKIVEPEGSDYKKLT